MEFIYDDSYYDNEYLITEDLDKYIELAPIHNGKKVLSEKAWDALFERTFKDYLNKSSFTPTEHTNYMKATREFGEKYECRF